ncbi:unnamed protein product [Orchesella dallaii]|uniref:Uncharacterized protein n=1 Tax=Orchesella dallaii TaxID=48710 RepID=A0ABP1S1F8_9HEXA
MEENLWQNPYLKVLDDTDCGRLEIIVKNKTDDIVYITKGEPIARIQFNRVNFPCHIAINKKELQDFINKLLFSRRQRRFVTIPSTMCITDDLTSPNDVITIPKSLSEDDSQNLDESVDNECMMALDLTKKFGVTNKQVRSSTAENFPDDVLDDVSDDEVSSNKRKKQQ